MLKPAQVWSEVDFLAEDNSDPPQLWAWRGDCDETAEPWFYVGHREAVEIIKTLINRVEEMEHGDRADIYRAISLGGSCDA